MVVGGDLKKAQLGVTVRKNAETRPENGAMEQHKERIWQLGQETTWTFRHLAPLFAAASSGAASSLRRPGAASCGLAHCALIPRILCAATDPMSFSTLENHVLSVFLENVGTSKSLNGDVPSIELFEAEDGHT